MLPGRKYTPEDILAIARQHIWLIVLCSALLSGGAYFYSRTMPDVYRSETLILVIPQRVPESYVRSTVTMRVEDRLRSIKQEILSRSRLEQIVRDFNLYPKLLEKEPIEVAIAAMRDQVQVDPIRDDAFKVSFDAESPRTAMIVTDRLAAMFIEQNLRDREMSANGTNQFLESQLGTARSRLLDHEQKLEAYRRRYSGELPSQLQANLQVIQGTQSQILSLTESINRDRDRRLSLEQSLADAPGSPAASSPATEEERAIEQLDTARRELQELQVRLRPEHPDVAAKRRAIAELERKVGEPGASGRETTGSSEQATARAAPERRPRARRTQAEIDQLDRQIAAKETDLQRLRQIVTDYGRRVEAVPGHESELVSLMRDYDTLQKVYADLLAKKENSQISANLERQQAGEQFRVLDPARLPEKPFSPNRVRIALIAAGVGLMLAFAIIGFLEYRDMSLRAEDEIVRTLVLPVIAAIPVMTALAEVHRRKRNRLLIGVATIVVVAGVSVAVWQLGR